MAPSVGSSGTLVPSARKVPLLNWLAHMKNLFFRRPLSQQFLLLSFPILLAGTLLIGHRIGRQVEDSVIHRMAGVTALYVDSFIHPHVQALLRSEEMSAADRAAIDSLLADTPLGKKIAGLKIWRRDGRVLYSTEPEQVGKAFAVDEGLTAALNGQIYSEISDRSEQEREQHGQPRARVIETYTPLHAERLGQVIAVAEFYHYADEVDRETEAAQRQSWMAFSGTMLVMYLLLWAVVRRGSETIVRQQADLSAKVTQLTGLNAQNAVLHQRVRRAAERTTTLNENFLQRLSADLHDGPGQDLGYALMQLESVGGRCDDREGAQCAAGNLASVRVALKSAMSDLRAISADLQLPDIQHLSLPELAARVVRDYESKTMAKVELDCSVDPDVPASSRIKITVCRVLQESLANVYRHGMGDKCRVTLRCDGNTLTIEVEDDGPGFVPDAGGSKGRLGLAGMRERTEVVGGTFEIESVAGNGTTVRVVLPLQVREEEEESHV
jgi:signal transduction histidine kinase